MVLDARSLPKSQSVEEEKAEAIVEEVKAEERESPIECVSQKEQDDPSGDDVDLDVTENNNLALALVGKPIEEQLVSKDTSLEEMASDSASEEV